MKDKLIQGIINSHIRLYKIFKKRVSIFEYLLEIEFKNIFYFGFVLGRETNIDYMDFKNEYLTARHAAKEFVCPCFKLF